MGRITDSLRATMRELAQSDARLYRGLREELGDTSTTTSQASPQLEGDRRASREELEGLSVKALWELCRQRGLKGLSSGPKPRQIDALLRHPEGPPLRSDLPLKAASRRKGGNITGKPGGAELQLLEQRLDRLEQLVVLIARQVGVPSLAITQLLEPPALPPT
jgi:hypothetical protein